jgi:hypothetical protein
MAKYIKNEADLWYAHGSMHTVATQRLRSWNTYDDPVSIAVESRKFDGHCSTLNLTLVDMMFCEILKCKGRNEAAKALRSLSRYMNNPLIQSPDGNVFKSHCGLMSSGSWKTSVGNGTFNGAMFTLAIMYAFDWFFEEYKISSSEDVTMLNASSNFKQECIAVLLSKGKTTVSSCYQDFNAVSVSFDPLVVIDNCKLLIEGDDGELITERIFGKFIIRGLKQVYETCGHELEEPVMTDKPEFTTFCSHGFAEVLIDGKPSGLGTPVRAFGDVFGRLLKPIRSSRVPKVDNEAQSRTLTSGMSMVASFIAYKQARDFWRDLRQIIPKSVVPRAVDESERWSHFNKFQGLIGESSEELASFDIDEFCIRTYGVTSARASVSSTTLRRSNFDLLDSRQIDLSSILINLAKFISKLEIPSSVNLNRDVLYIHSENCLAVSLSHYLSRDRKCVITSGDNVVVQILFQRIISPTEDEVFNMPLLQTAKQFGGENLIIVWPISIKANLEKVLSSVRFQASGGFRFVKIKKVFVDA